MNEPGEGRDGLRRFAAVCLGPCVIGTCLAAASGAWVATAVGVVFVCVSVAAGVGGR